jgi:hypothetical protein
MSDGPLLLKVRLLCRDILDEATLHVISLSVYYLLPTLKYAYLSDEEWMISQKARHMNETICKFIVQKWHSNCY